MAVPPDGRVVSGGEDGVVLLWDPSEPDAYGPVYPGGIDRSIRAMATLADGRVVSGGEGEGRVLLRGPAEAVGGSAIELGRHDGWVLALGVLLDGRVVSGGGDGRVLLWDTAGSQPVELGRHDHPHAHSGRAVVAVLWDGRVVSAGADGRVRLWDVTTQSEIAQLGCSSTALAAGHRDRDGTSMVIAHAGTGLSFWSVAGATTK